jgi:hypothetical protein
MKRMMIFLLLVLIAASLFLSIALKIKWLLTAWLLICILGILWSMWMLAGTFVKDND